MIIIRTTEEIRQIARQSFSSMTTLYHPKDMIKVEQIDSRGREFSINYESRRFGNTSNPVGCYFEINTFWQEVIGENVTVNEVYERQDFGTQMSGAKEKILRNLGFSRANAHNPLPRSIGFWLKVGYTWQGGQLVKML